MFKEPVILDEPVISAPPRSTTRPFFTLNWFAICHNCFHFPTVNINTLKQFNNKKF
jgi:hypothetical protein